MEDEESGDALDVGVALRPYWEAHGTLPDELRLLRRAVETCPNAVPSLHAGLNLLAQLTLTAGRQRAGAWLRAARRAGGRR